MPLLTNEMMSLPVFQAAQSCAPGICIAWEQRTKHNHTQSQIAQHFSAELLIYTAFSPGLTLL